MCLFKCHFYGFLQFLCVCSFLAWFYQAARPPPPKTFPVTVVTTPRIQLKDGRYLAYKELGVPKDKAKHKIVFVHGFRFLHARRLFYNSFSGFR
ncbi:hypothetical protein ACS0TY_018984 [Phlomoides rotata]